MKINNNKPRDLWILIIVNPAEFWFNYIQNRFMIKDIKRRL